MRKRQLDGLRFYAFLLVFFFHVGTAAIGPPFDYGQWGTELFFALSGFLITRLLLLNIGDSVFSEIKTFYTRRTLRIFPVYYAYLIILLLCHYLPDPLWYFFYVFNIKYYMHFGGVPHLWTLSVEEQYYLVYPILLLLTPKKWRFALILFLLCVFEISRPYFIPGHPDWYAMTLTRTALMWGSLAGYLDVRYAESRIKGSFLFIIGLSFSVLYGYLTCIETKLLPFRVFDLHYPYQPIAYALIVWGLWRTENKILLAPFRFPPIAYLGQISYGLYLFHGTNFVLRHWLIIKMKPLQVAKVDPVFFLLSLTIVQSMISWHFFEKPINDLKDRFQFKKQSENDPTPAPEN